MANEYNSNDAMMIAGIDYMSNISNAAIQAAASRKERKQAVKDAREDALTQRNWQLEDWQRTNEYNSPLAKRRRLEEAGISPWAEYGQMANSADMIKAPSISQVAPAEGIRMPQMNMLGAYMSIKQSNMQQAQLAASLESEYLKQENQRTENALLSMYLTRQAENDIAFKQAEQAEASKQWNRLQADHEKILERYEREREQYEYNKTQRKYHEKGLQNELEEQQRRIGILEKQLQEYDIKAELLRQEHGIKAYGQLRTIDEYQDYLKERKYKDEERNQRLYMLRKYGLWSDDSKFNRTLMKTQENILSGLKGMFSNPYKDVKAPWLQKRKFDENRNTNRLEDDTYEKFKGQL